MSTAAKPWTSRVSIYGVSDALAEWHDIVESNDGEVSDDLLAALAERMAAVPDAIDQAAGLVKALDAECDEIRAEEKRLAARRQAVEAVTGRVKEAIVATMQAAGVKSAKGRFTVSLVAGRRSVEIVDVAKVPDAYLVQRPPDVDKRAIEAAMKDGADVDGAGWRQGSPYLVIK